jgi:hypothetical protein
MNTQENEYNVRFYYDEKLMRCIDVTAEKISDAVSIAMRQIEGFTSWNEISVELYRDGEETNVIPY